ncbi:MAG: nodulation protein NfeD [Halobacteriota archaeon]|nr:nodulation protein NfeD [Halobacteriota archaeon]
MRKFGLIIAISLVLSILFNIPVSAAQSSVYLIEIEGTISMGTSMDVREGLREAIEMGANAVLIELDTPGGLVDAMDEITQEIENSPIPVITYVPKGAKSFSAGSFILLSGHVAAMAPGTPTGAATPISMGMTGEATPVENKTVNAYAAMMRGIALRRGRDAETAELFVTKGISLTAEEALEKGVIDLISTSREDLLEKTNGMTVEVQNEEIILSTKDAEVIAQEVTIRSEIVNYFGNPQIAFILLMVGIYGIIFGFMAPGTYVPETIGVICLVLALYGIGFFEVNVFGMVLIIVAMLMFVGETLTPTFGILTLGGIVCLIIGAFMFPVEPFLSRGWFESFRILVYTISVSSAIFFIFALTAVVKIRRQRSTTGTDELLEMVGIAESDISPEGKVKVRGEIWNAITRGEEIREGEKVKVLDRDGLTLIVESEGPGGQG